MCLTQNLSAIMRSNYELVREASRETAMLSEAKRNAVLLALADSIDKAKARIIDANSRDLEKMDSSNPLYDRLLLTPERLDNIASDMRHVAALPSPLGKITAERTLENGLHIRRVSVPFGVIGVIYEARPNVTFDVFSLCFKSGNACLLKGSSSAEESNKAIVELIKDTLTQNGISPDTVHLMPSNHDATLDLLNARGLVDLVIPRGGKRLINFVRENAHVPVIETGAGVVHAYFDKDGDIEKGIRIIENAKTRRPSVCNSLDTLLVHRSRENDLQKLLAPMEGRVEFIYDEYGTEWMDMKLSVRIVDSIDEALLHIRTYGSGHSECIITENETTAQRFQQEVDAACVYVNAPTSFTDGAQFGLGAEIGISTQKLGPRGPMGLEEMTTYKWLINGCGQTRA